MKSMKSIINEYLQHHNIIEVPRYEYTYHEGDFWSCSTYIPTMGYFSEINPIPCKTKISAVEQLMRPHENKFIISKNNYIDDLILPIRLDTELYQQIIIFIDLESKPKAIFPVHENVSYHYIYSSSCSNAIISKINELNRGDITMHKIDGTQRNLADIYLCVIAADEVISAIQKNITRFACYIISGDNFRECLELSLRDKFNRFFTNFECLSFNL